MVLVIGIFLGIIGAYLLGFNSNYRAYNWGAKYLTPNWFTRPKNILWRAKFLTRSTAVVNLLPVFPILAIVFGSFALTHFYNAGLIIVGMPVGFFLAFLGRERGQIVQYSLFQKIMPKVAARKVAQHCPPEKAIPFLRNLFYHKEPDFSVAALSGVALLPPDLAFPLLEEFLEKGSGEVQEVAQKLLVDMNNAAFGLEIHRVKVLEENVAKFRLLLQRKGRIWLDLGHLRPKSEIVALDIEAAIQSQIAVKNAFPHTYCKACNAFCVENQYLQWKWVKCRHCGEARHLERNVQKVVGQIGGTNNLDNVNGTVYIRLWNPETQMAQAADIHQLEILGGSDLNYDWAVNAVLQQLENQNSQLRDFKVVLTDNPSLDPNSLRLLNGLVQSAKSLVDPPLLHES